MSLAAERTISDDKARSFPISHNFFDFQLSLHGCSFDGDARRSRPAVTVVAVVGSATGTSAILIGATIFGFMFMTGALAQWLSALVTSINHSAYRSVTIAFWAFIVVAGFAVVTSGALDDHSP
jgi:hypothetical protein